MYNISLLRRDTRSRVSDKHIPITLFEMRWFQLHAYDQQVEKCEVHGRHKKTLLNEDTFSVCNVNTRQPANKHCRKKRQKEKKMESSGCLFYQVTWLLTTGHLFKSKGIRPTSVICQREYAIQIRSLTLRHPMSVLNMRQLTCRWKNPWRKQRTTKSCRCSRVLSLRL